MKTLNFEMWVSNSQISKETTFKYSIIEANYTTTKVLLEVPVESLDITTKDLRVICKFKAFGENKTYVLVNFNAGKSLGKEDKKLLMDTFVSSLLG